MLFSEPATTAASANWISAHCDGGARGNPGPAGYGAQITDAKGQVIAELSEYLGHRTNNFAEYSGLLGVLDWALTHHHPNLRVVSDSELMVKQIQGKYKVNSPDLRPLWEEARRRIARLDHFQITHALRHKNKDADRLANEAMDRGTGRGPAGKPGTSSTPGSNSSPSAAAPAKASSQNSRPAATSPASPVSSSKPPAMLRGFTRDGAIHLLGNATLPDGIFVKIVPE